MSNTEENDDEQVIQEKSIQESEIIQTDIKNSSFIEKIIEHASAAYEGAIDDKDICTKLKTLLDNEPMLNEPSNPQNLPDCSEHGVWQCIIGRQFCASVTFDAEYMVYFSFPKLSKYFMIFRS